MKQTWHDPTIYLLSMVLVGVSLCDRELVIIDTDPGIDDALALATVLQDEGVEVIAITCVRGNANISQAASNLFKILRVACNLEVPVYIGNDHGMVESPQGNQYFGKDGFGDLGLEELKDWNSRIKKEHAALYLARITKEKPYKIKILALGPLTNIALAIELNSDFLREIKSFTLMGGSIRGVGNIYPNLEFNFYMDPHAIAVVLDRLSEHNSTITLIPLETCLENYLGEKWWFELSCVNNNPMIQFLDRLEEKSKRMHYPEKHIPLDAYAAAVLLSPQSVLRRQTFYGMVETSGIHSKGSLIVDYNKKLKRKPNLDIIMNVNTTVLRGLMSKNLSKYKKCPNEN